MDSGPALDVDSHPEQLTSSAKQTRGCKITPQQIPNLQGLPVIVSEIALSYSPHRKQVNNDDVVALLAHIFSKLELSSIPVYEGQTNRPGTGDGSGSSDTRFTGPRGRLVVDRTARDYGFGAPQCGHQKQISKRPGGDDGSSPPNKLPMADEEDSVKLFLCPFYVRNRHPLHECSKRRFRRTSDVRQHILRVHIQAPPCPSCGETFDNDPSLERLHRHIAARTCQIQSFSITGITAEQFQTITEIANQRHRHRSNAVERWMMMWRVIYPGVDDPESPYASGETDLVQGMLDVRAAIENDQSRELSSGTSATNFGPYEWSIIDHFISVARPVQHGHSRATTLAGSSQTPSGDPAPLHAAQGPSNPAPPSSSIQPPTNQAGGQGLAANPLAQGYAPPLVQSSESQDPGWTGIYQPEFGEGSSQPLVNQELSWDDFLGSSEQYTWGSYRPN
ncbi:hypothetical protein INS49_003008 [Diaporthe citri]|uniref:uncharacterized protein n=1 Tax=Diaporthe citri TaxID=83186 RepID=UPI001C80333B|nr:uncharacterized protein INS49_003008 [Diaporthe citri]KAG6368794.1 hypothetical protein INS49_003008 [Diaporthe citri]